MTLYNVICLHIFCWIQASDSHIFFLLFGPSTSENPSLFGVLSSPHQPFVYFRSSPFHAEQVAYRQLVWGCLLKMAAHGFIFLGIQRLGLTNQNKELKSVSRSRVAAVPRLYSYYAVLSSVLLPVRDTVWGDKPRYCPPTFLDTTKKGKSCYLKKYKAPRFRVLLINQSSVGSQVQKSEALTIAASFDVIVSSRPLCKEHNRWLDVLQY